MTQRLFPLSRKAFAGYIKETCSGENAEFLIYDNKLHNPNYTVEAAAYVSEAFGEFNRQKRDGKLKTYEQKKAYFADTDWERMTAQDEDFWKRVFDFFEKK